jgi:hypothetical protein
MYDRPEFWASEPTIDFHTTYERHVTE